MSRILTVLFAVCIMAAPAFARDDGGFGTAQFPPKAPAALGDYVADSFENSPATLEPAAGEEEDVQAPEESLTADKAGVPEEKAEEKKATDVPAPKVETIPAEKAPQE